MSPRNFTTHVTRRSPKTKTIESEQDVRWHFSYAESSEDAAKKLREVAQILYRFGAEHRFFEEVLNTQTSTADSNPLTSIPSLLCK